jgi:predicted permease
MYSALRALVLQPFSYPNQGQVVQMWPGEDRSASPLDFLDIKEQASSFRELGAYTPNQTNLGGDNSQAVRGARCTAGVLRAFGVAPAAGRILETSDEAAGAPAVAVISNGLWRRAFAADPGVVGRVVPIDGVGTTIVGVMPAGFEFASPWYRGTDCEIWTPLRLMRDGSRADGWLACVGRLKDWIAIATADAEVKAISARLAAEFPETNSNTTFLVRSMKGEMTRFVGAQMWMLFGAVILVLLVACANVASMLLARNAMRQGEFGLRVALGALRHQIGRLILAESLALSLGGSAAGVVLAVAGTRILSALTQTTDTRRSAMAVDGHVLAFAVAATLATALLSGLPAILATSRLSMAEASRGESRSVAGSGRRQRLLRALVIAQAAVAFVLANLAVLFSASYLKVLAANQGLASDFVLSGEVDLHGGRYDQLEDRLRLAAQLAERSASLPGVTAAGITSKLPLEGGTNSTLLVNREVFDPKADLPRAEISSISPGYFAAAGIRLLRGRTLEAGDAGKDGFGVVVNRALAEKCWPGQDPLGKVIRSNSPTPYYHAQVVGVVEDVRQWGPKETAAPEMYWTLDHAWSQTIFLVVRSSQPASRLAPLLRRELAALDRDLPMSRLRTLRRIVEDGAQPDRAVANIVDFFMAAALGLVAVGLYGTLSYWVLQRTREIGIRVAVGAERGRILRLVLRQGLGWVGGGVGLGAAAALALGAGLRAAVWGVDPLNGFYLFGSGALVSAVAAVACWIPAWRASGVDPIVALRSE